MQHGVSDPIHGLEKAGAIDNMLLQTDGGVMRVFHVWPSAKDASLVKLRDKGGMLVSSARSGGQVTYVDITSLAGKAARLQNPWPGRTVRVTRADGSTVAFTMTGDRIDFPTQSGTTYTITAA